VSQIDHFPNEGRGLTMVVFKGMQLTQGLMLAGLACVAIGCGGGDSGANPPITAQASGKVTADGKPVTEAVINFENVAVGAWGTKLKPDGTYELKLTPGDFNVTVVPIPPPSNMDPSGGMPTVPKREEIPKKYRTGSTTPAKAKINEGENTFDVVLE
jgi:hypothetical protein